MEAILQIRKEAKNLPREKILYAMRKLRVKPICIKSVDTMAFAVALFKYHIPLSVELLEFLDEVGDETARNRLHILGDKKCLTIVKRAGGKYLEWILSDWFIKAYFGDEISR